MDLEKAWTLLLSAGTGPSRYRYLGTESIATWTESIATNGYLGTESITTCVLHLYLGTEPITTWVLNVLLPMATWVHD